MLSILIEQRLQPLPAEVAEDKVDAYQVLLGDPLQHVQRLLGHKSLETTQVYLHQLAMRNVTVDAAIAEPLSSVSEGDGR